MTRRSRASLDYYDAAGIPPLEVFRRWSKLGQRAYDEVYAVSPTDLWPYREYWWRPDCHRDNRTGEHDDRHWREIEASLRLDGWLVGDPAWMSVGKNTLKVSEGNHRLALAHRLNFDLIPVRYTFTTRVSYERDPCAGMNRHGPGPRVTTANLRERRERRRMVEETEEILSRPRREIPPEERATIDEIMALLDGRK